jgi:DnaJ-like protein
MQSGDISAAGESARRAGEAGVSGAREITFDDVLRAGRVLFGPAFAAEAGGWRERLKETYRRRALETHPDRARSLGRAEPDLAREFRAVADAYRILSSLRAGPVPGASTPSRPEPSRRPSGAARPAPQARTWTPRRPERPRPSPPRGAPSAPAPGPRARVAVRAEELPRRRLRFAEFLYYSGRVRWSDLVEALAWQRAQRPPLGRIAVELGFLGPDDPGVVLERRREAGANAVPFGEWAVRLGYLTSFQLLALLGHQLRLQCPIGRFFVERGMIEPGEIDAIRRRILRHNASLRG